MALLDERAQAYPQQRHRSAWRSVASGLAGIHSAESIIDRILPDTGAENVFNYILSRRDPGSYHVLVDFDSVLYLARWEMMTWHIAANNLNGPATGFSFACRSVDFNPDDWWTQKSIGTMGTVIRNFWTDLGKNVAQGTRWLNKLQVDNAAGNIVGLAHHGTVQPGDRSDAWALHPRRVELDAMLLNAIDNGITVNPTPPEGNPTEGEEELTKEEMDQLGAWMQQQADRTIATLKSYVDQKVLSQLGTIMARDPQTGRVYEMVRGNIFKRYVTGPSDFDTMSMYGVPYVGDVPIALVRARVTQTDNEATDAAIAGVAAQVQTAWIATEQEVIERLKQVQAMLDLDDDGKAQLAELAPAA